MTKVGKLAAQIAKNFRDPRSLRQRHQKFVQDFDIFVAPWFASMDAQSRFEPWKARTLPSIEKHLKELITALEKKARNHDAALWSLQQAAYFEPQVFSRKAVARLEKVFRDHKEISYFLNILSQHPRTRPMTRQRVMGLLASSDRFLLKDRLQKIFTTTSRNILMVHTIADGMGDELIRMAPLLRSLLEVHPQNKIMVISERPHLYGHPRLRVFHPRLQDEIKRYFANDPFDVVISQTDPQRTSGAHAANIRTWLDALVKRCPPQIQIARAKGNNRFTFTQVMFQGRDYLDVLRLGDIPYYQSHVYETNDRLCAELGFPLQFPVEKPTQDCPLTSIPYKPAQALWTKIENHFGKTHTGRPLWLVNPFGGGYKEKGFYGRGKERGFGRFREHLAALISEGKDVVVMPNHQPWGTPQTVYNVLRLLPQRMRVHTVVGPDPMQDEYLIKHLVAKCDGVVAVEGGLVHLAHVLDKPFRVLLGEFSGDSFWLPLNGLGGVAQFSQASLC